ncbi:MAG: apolipoprotein N-acyltransferase [Clostridia bacterium]
MGFFPVLYSWLAKLYPFEMFDFTSFQGICIVILAVFGIALYHSLVVSLIFLISKFFPKKNALLPIGTAFLFVFYEWFLSVGDLGFSWGTVAITQVKFLPLLRNVSLFGAYFITFIVVAFCGYLAIFIKTKSKLNLSLASAFLIVPMISGIILMCIPIQNKTEIKAAAVQGNIISTEKWNSERANEIVKEHIELAREAAKNKSQIIVLAESAFPVPFTSAISSKLAEISKEYGCTIVTGALIFETSAEKHNAIIAIKPDGSLSNYYTKRRLVPFGESMPLESVVNFVFDLLNIKFTRVPFVKGDGTELIKLENNVVLGGLVCFDSIFTNLSRDTVNDGANLITVVTNDSWYEDSAAVDQHVNYAVLRAVENGRYIIRAANTGVSCFITPTGKVLERTLPLVKDITYSSVYTCETRTVYSYVGDLPLYLSFVYLSFCAFLFVYNAVKSRFSSNAPKK